MFCGENLYWFAPNVQIWVDFLGLAKGAANPVVKATIEVGKRAHKNYYFTLGGGYDFESSFRTKSGKNFTDLMQLTIKIVLCVN